MSEKFYPEWNPSPYRGAESEQAREGVRLHDVFMEVAERKIMIEKEKALLETRELLAKIDYLEAQIANTRSSAEFIKDNKLIGPAARYESYEGLSELANMWQKELDEIISSVDWSVVSHKFGDGDHEKNLVAYTPSSVSHTLGTRWAGHGNWIKTYETPRTIENARNGAEEVVERFKLKNAEVRRMTLPDFDSTYGE